MKYLIYTITAAFFVTLFLSFTINADEGWWTNLRITGGAYYSKVEHPDIILEKEVLKYCGNEGVFGGCEAHFLFKNTNQHPVSVKVGFPVKIVSPLEEVNGLDPSQYLRKQFRFEYGSSRKIMSWSSFEVLNSLGPSSIINNITIIQDGRKIDIDSVLIDCNIAKPDTDVIQFHFLHKLDFRPDSYSNVVIKYSAFSSTMNTGSSETVNYIDWRYILGTGKTRKGPIKTIYVLIPDHLKPELPKSFNYIGDFKQNKIFMARNYEPSDKDEVAIRYISCSVSRIGYIHPIKAPETPVQSFVDLKGVSSYLPQKTWINSSFTGVFPRTDTLWKNIFDPHYYTKFYKLPEALTPAYVIEDLLVTCKNIGFGPLSLFDGRPESAWCEGAKGDGLDEWIEFELNEDVLGIAICNGFVKSPEYFYDEFKEPVKASKIKATYSNNNRVKLMEFISADSARKHKITLKDTQGRQVFEDIYLPKGIYKLYIRDIYKGTRWDDTCLGEIEFYSASARSIVEQDDFFKKVYIAQSGTGQANFQNDIASPGAPASPSISKGSRNFVIVWSGHWQEGQKRGRTIYGQRFSSNVETLGHSFKVSEEEGTEEPHYPTISASFPAVAIDGSGNFVVTWQDERNRDLNRPGFSNEDIYAQRYASDGMPLGSNFKVNDDTGNDDDWRREYQTFPSISMDRSGNFVISWSDARNDFVDKDIYAQRYSSDGTALGRNFRVNDDQGSVEQYAVPSVSMDKGGNFVITWLDTRDHSSKPDIYAQRYSSDGTALGHNFKVSDEKGWASEACPSVSTNGSGNFVITWSVYGSNDIYAQRYSSNGTALGRNFKVSSFFQGSMFSYVSPFIATNKRGNFIIGWLDGHDDVINIYAQRYASDGTALGSKFKVNDAQSIVCEDPPSISTYGNGSFIIWYYDRRNGEHKSDTYAQRYSSDGSALGSNFKVNDK